jgi:hypothetical protein
MLPQILVAAGAAIALLLGFLHLAYTFFTPKFSPRDGDLESDMRRVSPRISSQMTMWRAWIGFNASHSLGLILFGAIYAYLSLFAWTLLVHSAFLIGLGIAFFVSYLLLAKLYWFRSPLIGVALAGSLYVLGILIAIH